MMAQVFLEGVHIWSFPMWSDMAPVAGFPDEVVLQDLVLRMHWVFAALNWFI